MFGSGWGLKDTIRKRDHLKKKGREHNRYGESFPTMKKQNHPNGNGRSKNLSKPASTGIGSTAKKNPEF